MPALVAGQGPFGNRQERGREQTRKAAGRTGCQSTVAAPASDRAAVARSLTLRGRLSSRRFARPYRPSAPRKGLLVLRTHLAGELRSEHVGQTVTLTGWIGRRRDHGGVTFLDLRDASGVAQVVVREDEAMHLRNEYVLKVVGTVDQRPEGDRKSTRLNSS